MAGQPEGTVTAYLHAINRGDDGAKAKLWAAVEDELRAIAAHLMRDEPAGHTLQTTALVNEAYMRLHGGEQLGRQSRAYFFRAAVCAMRRILIDHARKQARRGRARAAGRVPLEHLTAPCIGSAADEAESLDGALRALEPHDRQTYDIVTFRSVCGLTVEQTAELLEIAPRTVKRRWRYGRIWLYRRMHEGESPAGERISGEHDAAGGAV